MNRIDLDKYLEEQLAKRQRMEEPEYLETARDARSDVLASQRQANLGAVLADSASLAGSLGGKRSDASAVERFARASQAGADDYFKGLASDDAMNESRMGRREQLAEYLGNKLAEKEKMASQEKLAGMKLAYEKDQDLAKLALEESNRKADRALKQAELNLRAKAHEDDSQSKKASETSKHGKIVNSDMAEKIGTYDAAQEILDQLEKSYVDKAGSRGSSFKSFIPGTDASAYGVEKDMAAQNIGQILESGKLTDNDYHRYQRMMPSPTDTNKIAKVKFDIARQQIAAKKRNAIRGFTEAGYDTSGFSPVPPVKESIVGGGKYKSGLGEAIAAPSLKPGDEDSGYIYIGGNPNDPKSWKEK